MLFGYENHIKKHQRKHGLYSSEVRAIASGRERFKAPIAGEQPCSKGENVRGRSATLAIDTGRCEEDLEMIE